RAARSRPKWYETRLWGSPRRAVSSRTRRSLSASSRSSRQRTGWPASARNAGGSVAGLGWRVLVTHAGYIKLDRWIAPIPRVAGWSREVQEGGRGQTTERG